MSEDTEGRHHRGMQHTIGGLTDHIVNTKKYTTDSHSVLHHSQHSLTPAYRCRLVDRHKHTITEQLIMGRGADTQSQQARFGGERETLTAGEGFIRAVGAVGPSITVPMARDAAAAGAAKLTLGTCGSSYVEDEEKHEITWRTRCVCVLTC